MAGRQVGNTTGDGYRRGAQKLCALTGKGITIVGSAAPNASANPDYDFWCDAVAGETLATRNSTISADLSYSAADIGIATNHGINDLVGGATSAQLQSLYSTFCGLVQAACPGAPILLFNVTSIGTGAAGYTPAVAAQILAYQIAFPAMITSLRSSGYNVYSCDLYAAGVITDPQDAAQLYDQTHYTPATYTRCVPFVADALMSAA
jgi:hypothetical protein